MTPITFFLFLAIGWTWPLVTRLSTRIAHDAGDPVLNAWILWWNTQAVPFTERWWNPPIFFPAPGSLALSEHLAGIALFTAPLHFAGLNAVAVYNLALLATCWLSAYFAFLLGRRLTGSVFGGFVCGIAFGFAPYRAGQLPHLQVLAAQWMPVALLAMHAFAADGRRRWLVLFAAAWIVQALSNGYYLLFFPLLVALWLVWFPAGRRRLELAATFAVASLALAPTLLEYRNVHEAFDLKRTLGEMLMFSARPQSFVQAPDLLAFWPPLATPTPEGYLFPGMTTVGLLILACVLGGRSRALRDAVRRRSLTLFYVVATLLFAWLAFGPARTESAADALVRPYTLLMWLPGFEGLRVPARFAMISTLCLAIVASIAAARLTAHRTRIRMAAGVLIVAGLFADTWIETMPLAALPARFRVPDVTDALVMELPADDPGIAVGAMYRAIAHGRPIVNGYSGHSPPHMTVLAGAMQRSDPTALTYFAAGRPLVLLIHRAYDRAGDWRRYVESAGARLVEESGLGAVYLLPPQPRERAVPLGDVLPHENRPAGAGYVSVDLGSERTVRAVSVELLWKHAEIAPRMLVETSTDFETWTPAWEGWTAAPALAGAIEHQRRVPMRFTLPDVRARYVRLSPAPPWMLNQLTIYAPK